MTNTTSIDEHHPDREDLAAEALALHELIQWISSARDLCDDLRDACTLEPELQAILRRRQVLYNSPGWTGKDAGNGLGYLMSYQRALIAKLTS
jgi:hypothetical protein